MTQTAKYECGGPARAPATAPSHQSPSLLCSWNLSRSVHWRVFPRCSCVCGFVRFGVTTAAWRPVCCWPRTRCTKRSWVSSCFQHLKASCRLSSSFSVSLFGNVCTVSAQNLHASCPPHGSFFTFCPSCGKARHYAQGCWHCRSSLKVSKQYSIALVERDLTHWPFQKPGSRPAGPPIGGRGFGAPLVQVQSLRQALLPGGPVCRRS